MGVQILLAFINFQTLNDVISKPDNTAQYDVSAGAVQVKPANTAQYDVSAGAEQVKLSNTAQYDVS